MTFKEFVAARRHVADIADAVGLDLLFSGEKLPGHVYTEGGGPKYWIHDPDDGRGCGKYWTKLNGKMVKGTLEQVERRLYLLVATIAHDSPEWLDDDFTVIYPVLLDEQQVGVMRCCVDGCIRPNGLSDSLPEWISDFWLENLEHCPRGVKSMGYSFGAPYFMP